MRNSPSRASGMKMLSLVVASSLVLAGCTDHINRLPKMVYVRKAVVVETTPETKLANSAPVVKDISALAQVGDVQVTFSKALTPAGVASAAQSFLDKNSKELGLEGSAANYAISDDRESMSGRFMQIEQRFHDIPIIDGHINISVSPNGEIQSLVRNIVHIPNGKTSSVKTSAALTGSEAQEIAWKDLGVTGELLEAPAVSTAYLSESDALTLVYVVRLAVSRPLGYWEYRIDATTGRVISKTDRRVQERKTAELGKQAASAPVTGIVMTSAQALKAFSDKQAATSLQDTARTSGLVASAPAMVFAPNPISALHIADLTMGAPTATFEKAYKKIVLTDMRRLNDVLYLTGSLVRIEDFEPGEHDGHVAPSTSSPAGWSARRGNNAFNDVNVYFHIAANMQYLRGLGYSGPRDLFSKGLSVDTDGLNGDDNSHYVPDSDRLAFGHGCVPDPEDTDVILHEFGHAIHHHLPGTDWSGAGDWDAIGEGFGDYWAVSHRMRMTDGLAMSPGKIFVWDGSPQCAPWLGRRVDKLTLKYDSAHVYVAHEVIGDFVSDELWSAPLVTSLMQLTALGESAESVDLIVLEGMTGLGNGFTMRTVALNTIAKAKQLQPGKQHAAVFEKNFRAVGIVQ